MVELATLLVVTDVAVVVEALAAPDKMLLTQELVDMVV